MITEIYMNDKLLSVLMKNEKTKKIHEKNRKKCQEKEEKKINEKKNWKMLNNQRKGKIKAENKRKK